MRPSSTVFSAHTSLLIVALTIGGCGNIKENKPAETAQARNEAKRHKDACASSTAYDRMKRVIFDQARGQSSGNSKNLDTLEAFSFIRMEAPVVDGLNTALDITRCKGRFILDAPPGSEQAFGGERRLTADIVYTAQGAADASGLIYTIKGAEPIVSKLASFTLSDAAYRPLPAVDATQPATELARNEARMPDGPAPVAPSEQSYARPGTTEIPSERRSGPPSSSARIDRPNPPQPRPEMGLADAGESTVRAFYTALGTGSGETASAQVIPQKRSGRVYSADAISRFYGRMSEPLRLTSIRPAGGGAYRVTYRYAAPGLRCNGSAVVRLTSGSDRPLIRSIDAANGC